MLDPYLYQLGHRTEHVSLGAGRVLRSGNGPQQASKLLQEQKMKEKKEEAAVRKLEKEMDRLTNEALLRDATDYQQGRSKSPLLITCSVTDLT